MAQPVTSIIDLGEPSGNAIKRVLNAGCGIYKPERLHAAFRTLGWSETRLDIDTRTTPDIVGSITDLSKIDDGTFDAIWCSHNLEHLYTHEVPKALAEFRRVLKPDGFALITSPDLEAVAELVLDGRIDDAAYQSPAGPITALDMLYGLSVSVARGNLFMSHHTGFTADRLGRLMIDSGFAEVLAKRGSSFDLWAIGLMPKANKQQLLLHLRANKLDMFPEAG
ncbi:MAG TPA: class I SAM-dependent methyltransferase [Xanthobacteraceae bacterium]|nr:class I SAM-dependent methyltransferase [Xanthobacteraceae bacterium]